MHKWVYEKAECLKNEICSKGIDNLTHENLEEAYYISKILKNMVCIDKDYHIVDAMEKSEKEENMDAIMEYTDYPDRRYYDEYRYSNGKFAPKGQGHYSRRGYESNPTASDSRRMYDEYRPMDVDMYRNEDYGSMADIDRRMGRRFYTPMANVVPNMNGMTTTRDIREGKAGKSRLKYFEHKDTADNQTKMKDLEEYMTELSNDVTEMIGGMTPEQKTLMKNKMNVLMTKIQ